MFLWRKIKASVAQHEFWPSFCPVMSRGWKPEFSWEVKKIFFWGGWPPPRNSPHRLLKLIGWKLCSCFCVWAEDGKRERERERERESDSLAWSHASFVVDGWRVFSDWAKIILALCQTEREMGGILPLISSVIKIIYMEHNCNVIYSL